MVFRISSLCAVAAFCVAVAIPGTASAADKVYVPTDASFTGDAAPEFKPTSLTFGTGGALTNIKYSSYGGAKAFATGTCGYKKFKPEGGYTWVSFPVNVGFSKIQEKHGYNVYTARYTTRTVNGKPQRAPFC